MVAQAEMRLRAMSLFTGKRCQVSVPSLRFRQNFLHLTLRDRPLATVELTADMELRAPPVFPSIPLRSRRSRQQGST